VIVLLCCYEFHIIVLKAEQSTRMQRRKDEECEAKERMLVSDFYFFFFFLIGSKDLCLFECHTNVLLRCFEFNMIVLKAEQATRMQGGRMRSVRQKSVC
jgi:hypothetical protein